ncbi:hypothetical protein TNCV_1495591 [Trichonephila clavipes]|nr:hypothetical protein TNCV_1495591 [Trichonephila clavipes]
MRNVKLAIQITDDAKKRCSCRVPNDCPYHQGLYDDIESKQNTTRFPRYRHTRSGRSSQGVRVWDRGCPYLEFEPSTTLRTRCVGARCTLNLSRAQMSFPWCGVVVRRGGASSEVIHVT